MCKNTDLHSLTKPAYYMNFIGRACRLKYPLTGVDKHDREVEMPADSLVAVTIGRYLTTPEPTDDCFRFSVVLLKRSGRVDPRYVTHDATPNDALQVEPGVIRWSPEDSNQAIGQGWDIFYCDGSDGPLYQLQLVNGSEEYIAPPAATTIPDRFVRDYDAWRFVWLRAINDHDPLCQHALAFLYYVSPAEYQAIRKHCTASQPNSPRNEDQP
jgi:hypothetical protein